MCNCNHNHSFNLNKELGRDPTRTKTLRNKFSSEFYKKFRELKGLINKTIVDNDALRLIESRPRILKSNVDPANDFREDSKSGKLTEFMNWFNNAVDEIILGLSSDTRWTDRFIRTSYRSGYERATSELKKINIDAPEYTSVEVALQGTVNSDAIELMSKRSFSELKGITQVMSQQIERELSEGLRQGLTAAHIAKNINDRVDKIGLTRSRILAQSEIVRTYNEAALNRYQEGGIDEVGAEVEFSNSGDTAVCDICNGLEETKYTIDEARGILPIHPRCRCVWLPVIN